MYLENLATIGLKYGKVVSDDIAQELFPGINTDNYKVKIEGEFELQIPAREVVELVKQKTSKYLYKQANKEFIELDNERQKIANEIKEHKKQLDELRRKHNKPKRKGHKIKFSPEIRKIEKDINSLKTKNQYILEKTKGIGKKFKNVSQYAKSFNKKVIKSFAGKMALKVLGRIAIKAVPGLGLVSLFYDAYQLGEFISDKILPIIETEMIPEIEKMIKELEETIEELKQSENYQIIDKVFIKQDPNWVRWFIERINQLN